MLAKLPIAVALRLGLFDRWLALQDPKRLCKRLQLDGYEHLVASDDSDGPLQLAVSPKGPWQAVLWTVAYYRGPIAVRLPSGADRSIAGLHELGVTASRGEAPRGEASRLAIVGENGEGLLRGAATVEGKGLRVRFTPA